MSVPRHFLTDLEAAQEAQRDRERARQEAREKRSEAAEQDGPALSKEEKSALRAQKNQLEKSLTRMLVTLAELGDIEGLKRAVAAGGSLERALDRSRTPLEAALCANQIETAHWLLDQKQLHFGPRRSGAMGACAHHDALDVLERLWERFPEVGARQIVELRSEAYHRSTAPRMALWLDKKAAALKVKEEAPESWLALGGALAARDMETAKIHLDNAAARLKSGKPAAQRSYSRYGWTPCLSAFLTSIFASDNAQALLFVAREQPELMASCAEVGVLIEPRPEFGNWTRNGKGDSMVERSNAYSKGELKIPLAALAARHNARDCLDAMLSIEVFKQPLLRSQAEPEKYLWEEVFFATGAPEIYASLKKAGFDFNARMSDGGNFLHAAFCADHMAKVFLERVGRDLSELIDQKNNDGMTPKQAFVQRRSYYAAKASKAEAILQKAGIKSVSKAGSRKKEVRAAAGPRRL